MRHMLCNSCVLKTKIWNACVRGIASEPVAQNFEGSDKTSTLGQRWQQHENQVLIAGIEKQELELEKGGKWNSDQTRREKWEEIETYCHLNGINRSAEQCRQRWQRLLHAFSKIKSWESCRPPGKSSFWLMKASEKKAEGLSFSLDLETFNALDAIQIKKGLAYSTIDFSNAAAVSTESPSSDANWQQQKIDDSETKESPSSEVNLQQQKMDDSETKRRAEETIACIGSDQEANALDQDSSTTLMNSTQQTSSNDDRPSVFVNAINECLDYLKDLAYDSREPVKAHVDVGIDADQTLYKDAENLKEPCCYGPLKDKTVCTLNAAGEAAESIKSEIPAERKNREP